jgi:hypothetical protein
MPKNVQPFAFLFSGDEQLMKSRLAGTTDRYYAIGSYLDPGRSLFSGELLVKNTNNGKLFRRKFDKTKIASKRRLFCDLGEIRTLDPLIKSQLLYQLSYEVIYLN